MRSFVKPSAAAPLAGAVAAHLLPPGHIAYWIPSCIEDARDLAKRTAAMIEFDPYDRLVDACRNSSRYPYTLLKETTSRAVLEGYSDHLLQNDDALFDSSKQRLVLWEAWPGAQSSSSYLHPRPVSFPHLGMGSLTRPQASKKRRSIMSST